jgi:undecaprenyl-diphosphatase
MASFATRLQVLDTRLLRVVRIRSRDGHPARIATWVTRSGDGPPYAVIAALVALMLGPEALPILRVWLAGFALERLLYRGLKSRLRRLRPFEVETSIRALVVPPDRFSFPSGHTSAAFLMAGLLSALIPVLSIPVFAWACAVGASRVCLSVHYPSDVFAGAMLGTAVARLVLAFG